MSFAQRHIDVEFRLGTGAFGNGPADAVRISGLRCSVTMMQAGEPSFNQIDLRVWGLRPSLMNQLSLLGKPITFERNNSVTVYVGNDGDTLSQIFTGTISKSYQDFQAMPDACLSVTAYTGIIQTMKPMGPTSVPIQADVAAMLQQIATQAGLKFENNGVKQILGNPYFPGTAVQQIRKIALASGILWTIDGNTLAIWPKDGSRKGQIPVFSPGSGMIGYPLYTDQGITVRSEYRPGVIFGGQFQVQSSLPGANGTWVVQRVLYELESEMPNGKWFMNIDGSRQENVAK